MLLRTLSNQSTMYQPCTMYTNHLIFVWNTLGEKSVMVNFMCQPGYAMVPRYLVKLQSRYCCEGIVNI